MVINKVSQKNKLRVSIIIMLMMLVIMSVSSLAWEDFPDTPDSEEYNYEEYIYQLIYDRGTYGPILLVSETPFYIQTGDCVKSSTGAYQYQYRDGNWNYVTKRTMGMTFDEILQSTHDIYMDDTLTEVFFSPPKVTTLVQVLNQRPPLSLMSPQIVGLLPYLIGLMIALAAFWKGWQFLSRTLRKG